MSHIGVFDSGFGGLTILQELYRELPEYSYIYLGDNARAPYGTRSFDTIYKYTLEAVKKLFSMDCNIIVIACNTASAKALRTIQQNDLEQFGPNKKVLGIIRPCTEIVNQFTQSNSIGIFATSGTVSSNSYEIEINKFFPDITVASHACPMWVPLVENGEANSAGADFFIKQEVDAILEKNNTIDSILLACTHYPMLYNKIRAAVPQNISIINQGTIVAKSLKEYLDKHVDIKASCAKTNSIKFYTTEQKDHFNKIGSMFWGKPLLAETITL